ncbi:MAG TPA: hypothetical protein VN328_13245 [Thermodesulfovibrionales bacterium]|nr:hypothetical protein [Thermodesulfovibrionales bacterium]
MRYVVLIIVFMSVLATMYPASGDVRPYGEYSEWCCVYGICKQDLGVREAQLVIEKIYSDRGLTVVNMQYKGRFIEVEIYKNNRLFDKILFDRKTGRIRSIF